VFASCWPLQDVDLQDVFEAQRPIVELLGILGIERRRGGEGLQRRLQAGEVAVDHQGQLARVMRQVGFDAADLGMIVAREQDRREGEQRHQEAQHQQHEIGPGRQGDPLTLRRVRLQHSGLSRRPE
jgi:hypothetical protein